MKITKLLAVLLSLALFAVACGSDSASDTDAGSDAASSDSDAAPAASSSAALDIDAILRNNDAYHAVDAAGDLIKIPATGTNVADIQIFLRKEDLS